MTIEAQIQAEVYMAVAQEAERAIRDAFGNTAVSLQDFEHFVKSAALRAATVARFDTELFLSNLHHNPSEQLFEPSHKIGRQVPTKFKVGDKVVVARCEPPMDPDQTIGRRGTVLEILHMSEKLKYRITGNYYYPEKLLEIDDGSVAELKVSQPSVRRVAGRPEEQSGQDPVVSS